MSNFEERYSGPRCRGNYIGGVYYPDKTRVGVVEERLSRVFRQSAELRLWIGVDVRIDGEGA